MNNTLDFLRFEEHLQYILVSYNRIPEDGEIEIKSVDDLKKYMKLAWDDPTTHNEFDFTMEPYSFLFDGSLNHEDELFFKGLYSQQKKELNT